MMLSTGPSGWDASEGKQATWYHLVASKPRGSGVEAPRRSAPEAMTPLHPLQVERPDLAYSTETAAAACGAVDMARRAARAAEAARRKRRRAGFRAMDRKEQGVTSMRGGDRGAYGCGGR